MNKNIIILFIFGLFLHTNFSFAVSGYTAEINNKKKEVVVWSLLGDEKIYTPTFTKKIIEAKCLEGFLYVFTKNKMLYVYDIAKEKRVLKKKFKHKIIFKRFDNEALFVQTKDTTCYVFYLSCYLNNLFY